jgi:ribosomal RNA-processing protein 8
MSDGAMMAGMKDLLLSVVAPKDIKIQKSATQNWKSATNHFFKFMHMMMMTVRTIRNYIHCSTTVNQSSPSHIFIMSRKRKNFSIDGDDSNRNDSKKKSKKQIARPVKAKPQQREGSSSLAEESLGGGTGDSSWSKSKKKRMRNLKSKLLKKQNEPAVASVDHTVKKTPVAKKNSSKNDEASSTSAVSASPKQSQQAATGSISEKQTNSASSSSSSSLPPTVRIGRQPSALQQAFQARLSGSRFRILNEELYTTSSTTAFERFSAHPELYDEYHDGFRSQVEHWPVNPVDVIVGRLKKEVDVFFEQGGNDNQLQQQQQQRIDKKQIVVADFGCGDADLAKQLLKVQIPIQQQQQRGGGGGGGKRQKNGATTSESTTSSSFSCPFCVHSFDLVSQSDLVTACDMSNVPLPSAAVDVAVFCLSLMGTNLADFVREAHRVLKSSGRLKIAEVKSRFASSSTTSSSSTKSNNSRSSKHSRNSNNKKNKNNNADGQDEEREFIQVLKQLGFECTLTDRSNKMFVLFELRKNGKNPDPKVEYTARPCIYKRR